MYKISHDPYTYLRVPSRWELGMPQGLTRTLLSAAALVALPGLAAAQFPPPPPPAGAPPSQAPVRDRWPDTTPQQSQQQQQQPAPSGTTAAPAPEAKPKSKPAAPANVIACNGVFGKDSTHLKLAIKYDSRNVAFTDVDGPDGSKIRASVLFPNDPKRRLEVLWNNEAARTDTQVIVITGQSQWTAPKGLKLGLALAALEKANGKPFKVSGFDPSGSASVTGWGGGALAGLPGGCKIGIRLQADRGAPAAVRGTVEGDKELTSSDAGVKAVKPTVSEILIGY
jgi:hypothetical protein